MPEKVEMTSAEISGGQATSRRKFMGYIGLAGAGAALVACSPTENTPPELTPAQKAARQDLAILNYALNLEYLEADFYRRFDSGDLKGKLSDPRVQEFAKELAAQEKAHVEALKATIVKLGGTPDPLPQFDYSSLVGDGSGLNDAVFLELAVTFEPVGTRAYLGQAARLTNPDLLAAAAAILAVEANHVSAIQELRTERGENKTPTRMTARAPQSDAKPSSTSTKDFDPNFAPLPTALWEPLTMAETLAIVGPLFK